MQKYGIKNTELSLEPEITKFLQNEKLNDSDLKKLDSKIHKLLLQQKHINKQYGLISESKELIREH